MMAHVRTALATFALCVTSAACSDGVTVPVDSTLEDRLQATLDRGFAQSNGKGASIAVAVPGRPLWTGVAGVSYGSRPITPRTVFAAGSITKTFTAVAVLRLAEEGRLGLDDRLDRWLPHYPFVDGAITIRQLLNHTSGLSDFTDDKGWVIPLLEEPAKLWDMEQYFVQTIRPPYFEKGTNWSYSTSGYILLRLIIQKASGSTVAEQYRKYVLQPLGMKDTYVCPADPPATQWAHGWLDITGDGIYDDFAAIPNTSFCSATGGQIYTTASDLATLGKALMQDRTLLSAASFGEMTDFYYPPTPVEPMLRGFGLGLIWYNDAFMGGHKVWGHSGNAPGYSAGMLYLVDRGVVVTVMDNTHFGESMGVVMDLLDVLDEYLGARESVS